MSEEKGSDVPGENEPEPFLQRWSRRKADARSGLESGSDSAPPEADAPGAPQASPVVGEAVELPDLDSLGEDSDYSAFMSPGVDADLRRKALRKLFSSPKFNVIDDMDDYSGDFTKFDSLGGIVTADMKHQMERLARAAAKALDEAGQTETAALAAAPTGLPDPGKQSEPSAELPEQEREEHDGNERPA
jgi:hypothetical protein